MFKGESIVYNMLIEKYGKENIQVNYRPSWLRNPDTGHNLELDFYINKEKLAFEVQGYHHYTNYGQMKRDALKRELCKSRGVELKEVKTDKRDFHALRLSLDLDSKAPKREKRYNTKRKRRERSKWHNKQTNKIKQGISAQEKETQGILRRKREANV